MTVSPMHSEEQQADRPSYNPWVDNWYTREEVAAFARTLRDVAQGHRLCAQEVVLDHFLADGIDWGAVPPMRRHLDLVYRFTDEAAAPAFALSRREGTGDGTHGGLPPFYQLRYLDPSLGPLWRGEFDRERESAWGVDGSESEEDEEDMEP